MASLGGEQQISSNCLADETTKRPESREGSVERKVTLKRSHAPAAAPTTTEHANSTTLHWFAQIGGDEDDTALEASKDRDEKLKYARDRQNEERQRKIEELKAQAEAAQRYREQKEEERRRRIEEIRTRDTEKRHQVEERKRAILEADKERREYILRKNQERESRIEIKKREKSAINFAFGSSTPRLLEPADFGMVSPSTFWSQRRSTSISNVAGASLSRRSSERELSDSATKKRATSASGTERHDDHRRKSSSMYEVFNWGYSNDEPPKRFSLSIVGNEINIDEPAPPPPPPCTSNLNYYHTTSAKNTQNNSSATANKNTDNNQLTSATTSARNNNCRYAKEDNIDSSHIVFRSVARRKTDLMPTIPSPRDSHYYGSRSSLSTTPRTPGSRSGNATPGGHISTSRPGSAMSTSTTMSNTGFVSRRPVPATRKARPASIAGTGVSIEEINKLKRDNKPPVKALATTSAASSAQTTPKRTSNMMSTSLIVTSSSRLSSAEKKTPAKREPITPRVTPTAKTLSKTVSSERLNKTPKDKPKETSTPMAKSMIVTTTTTTATINNLTPPLTSAPIEAEKVMVELPAQSKEEKDALNSIITVEDGNVEQQTIEANAATVGCEQVEPIIAEEKVDDGSEKVESEAAIEPPTAANKSRNGENSEMRELTPPTQTDGNDIMTASMIAKSKITTEEEAKAALAERRRLAREEAERQAELERQRVEAERLAELKRQEEEAERQRQFEEEATRLAEEQRRGEEERLRLAIEEAKQREEEEVRKREEDERQRVEREEAEKKAKEEAEKQRIEVAERLKREEKEREERRKRVEAIMSRTRKGGPAAANAGAVTPNNSTPNKTESNDSPKTITPNNIQNQQQMPAQSAEPANSENSSSTSGSNTSATTPTPVVVQTATIDAVAAITEPQNSQAMYEQSVIDKENSLINSFSNLIIDENAKNLQQHFEVSNGKILADFPISETILQTANTVTTAVANGNGHIENINNKNDINILQDVVTPASNQLIDLSIESQDINNPFINNNNSLLTTTTTLVTADSHENKDISLL